MTNGIGARAKVPWWAMPGALGGSMPDFSSPSPSGLETGIHEFYSRRFCRPRAAQLSHDFFLERECGGGGRTARPPGPISRSHAVVALKTMEKKD